MGSVSLYTVSLMVFVIALSKEASGQTFTLQAYNKSDVITRCHSDLLAGDKFVFYGTLDNSGADIGPGFFQRSAKFTIGTKKTSEAFYVPLCEISAYASDCGVSVLSNYCSCYAVDADKLKFVVNHTALTYYSDHQIRAEWRKNDLLGDVILSDVRSIPTIYETEVTTFFVNGILHPLDEDIEVEEGKIYEIRWCVNNLTIGSIIEIKLDSVQVAMNPANNYCTSSYYLGASSSVIGKALYLSYSETSGCQRSGQFIVHVRSSYTEFTT